MPSANSLALLWSPCCAFFGPAFPFPVCRSLAPHRHCMTPLSDGIWPPSFGFLLGLRPLGGRPWCARLSLHFGSHYRVGPCSILTYESAPGLDTHLPLSLSPRSYELPFSYPLRNLVFFAVQRVAVCPSRVPLFRRHRTYCPSPCPPVVIQPLFGHQGTGHCRLLGLRSFGALALLLLRGNQMLAPPLHVARVARSSHFRHLFGPAAASLSSVASMPHPLLPFVAHVHSSGFSLLCFRSFSAPRPRVAVFIFSAHSTFRSCPRGLT